MDKIVKVCYRKSMYYPLISVIIPTYNNAATIGFALDAMLAQTYPNVEIIVVDDMSADNTRGVVGCYMRDNLNIRYFKVIQDDPYRYNEKGVNINAGWSARNFGIEQARGELVTFQDADDGACANRIAVQYELMQEYNSHHVVVDWQRFNERLNCRTLDIPVTDDMIVKSDEVAVLVRKTKPRRWFRRREISYPCSGNNPLVKREVFEKVRFRPLWERTRPSRKGRGADQDFNYAVAETFEDSIAVKIPLVLWRVNNQNPDYEDNKYREVR